MQGPVPYSWRPPVGLINTRRITRTGVRSIPDRCYEPAGNTVKAPSGAVAFAGNDNLHRVYVTLDIEAFERVVEVPHCVSVKEHAAISHVPFLKFVYCHDYRITGPQVRSSVADHRLTSKVPMVI